MAAKKLDPNVINNAIGLYLTKSGPVTLDADIGELATWVKCTTGGVVRWYNKFTKETGDWILEDGEGWAIGFTSILSAGTTASGLYWGSSGTDLGRPA